MLTHVYPLGSFVAALYLKMMKVYQHLFSMSGHVRESVKNCSYMQLPCSRFLDLIICESLTPKHVVKLELRFNLLISLLVLFESGLIKLPKPCIGGYNFLWNGGHKFWKEK